MAAAKLGRYRKNLAAVSVPALLSGSAAGQSVVPRTIALVATISLVAFALYMTRPAPLSSTPARANQSAMHATSTEPQQEKGVEQSPSDTNQAGNNQNVQTDNSSTNHANVTVNGQNIPVPADGNLHKTITDGDSTTTINLSSNGSGTSTSTTNISVQSSSSSSSSSGDGT